MRDPKVLAIFLKKIAEGHIFTGIHCDPSDIFEHVIVVINFRCADGVFCLIPPTFAAIVDVMGGRVTTIIDPYLPRGPRAQSMPQSSATSLSGVSVGN